MAAEFSRRTESLLNRAEAICEHRGANLTELRRNVLGMILDAASPTGAYELLDRLRALTAAGDTRVVLVAHSQVKVIAAATMLQDD